MCSGASLPAVATGNRQHPPRSQAVSKRDRVWARPRLLVLAGSAVRTKEALDDAAAPLHGRFDWKRRIAPFDYWDAGLMVPYRDLEDRAAIFGIFGGMPRY